MSLPFGTPDASDSGSCNATDTTVGDREDCTSSSLAPEDSPDRRIVLDKSICLLLCLYGGLATFTGPWAQMTHLLQPIQACIETEFGARLFKNIIEVLPRRGLDRCSTSRRIDDYHMRSHASGGYLKCRAAGKAGVTILGRMVDGELENERNPDKSTCPVLKEGKGFGG